MRLRRERRRSVVSCSLSLYRARSCRIMFAPVSSHVLVGSRDARRIALDVVVSRSLS